MFSQQDLAQIQSRGSEIAVVEEQLHHFKKGFPYMQLTEAACIGRGIMQLTETELTSYIEKYVELGANLAILKLKPG